MRPLLAEKVIFHIFWVILVHFWPFLRVFGHFLKYFCLNSVENRYVDRTNHYLQLFYWHQGLKSSSSHFKIGSKLSKMVILRLYGLQMPKNAQKTPWKWLKWLKLSTIKVVLCIYYQFIAFTISSLHIISPLHFIAGPRKSSLVFYRKKAKYTQPVQNTLSPTF